MSLALSANLTQVRRADKVNLAHEGNVRLGREVCGHANFAEYVPLVLLLMGIAELGDTPSWRVHLLGGLLLTGRLLHADCFTTTTWQLPFGFGGGE